MKSPLVYAHRGACKDAPENSFAAFRIAEEQGADGVELDVMRCASGEVVVFHDDDLERLGGGRRGLVRSLSYAALCEVDLGGGERIPTLDAVLEQIGDRMRVNVELKSAPTWLGRLIDDRLAEATAEVLSRHRAGARVIVSSFDPLLLKRFERTMPGIETGLLFASDQSRPLREAWASRVLKARAVHPEAALVDAVHMRAWKSRGLAVNVWTVDEPAELRALAALGVDAIITNRPSLARTVLAF